MQRCQHALRTDLADALQAVQQLLLLEFDLARRIEVLQAATGTGAEVRAGRLDAIRTGQQNLIDYRIVVLAMALDHMCAHALARQCAIDEHGLGTSAGDAASVM